MENLTSLTSQSWLSWLYRGLIVLAAIFLLGRMLELQIIKGNYFRSLAENNRIRRITISAPRGRILARGGEELVGNVEVKKEIKFDPKDGYIKEDTHPNSVGENIIAEPERVYFFGSDLAHVNGYLGEANEDEVGKVDPKCPEKGVRKPKSLVGRGGLEEEYDCLLRGIDGEELVEVDTMGRRVRTLGTKEPVPGQDLKTTIDLGLQKKVVETVKNIRSVKGVKLEGGAGDKGAVVITDARGQVLAFYSSPSFDPANIPDAINDKDLPLFNRVIGGAYHPGSTFKIVTSIAGLEEKKIDAKYTYDDPGVIKVNEFEYSNWLFSQAGATEGRIDLPRAIARSTDTFFYKVGEFVGAQSLASWARKFGLGSPTGIDLPGEISGLVPDPQWKKDYKDENWFLGNTYHMAIGQGDLTATPIEVNQITGVVASGGKLCKPHLVDGREDCKDLGIERKNIALVRQGMSDACSEGGTAPQFIEFGVDVGCKTGTAETEEEKRTHAWFTVFAPLDYPEIVGTLLVEKGGEGSSVASPVMREILDYWLLQRNP